MKSIRSYKIAAILLFAVLVAAAPFIAEAANTTAGVQIGNSAVVSYSVGSVSQPPVTAPTVTFAVDRLVTFTVTNRSNLTTAPSWTYQAIQFTVSNTSNTAMRFALQPVSSASNTWTLTGASIYRDNNSSGTYDAGDTLYVGPGTFGDVASGATLTLLIVGDIPVGLTTGQSAVYSLLATAIDSGGTTTTTQTAIAKSSANANLLTVFAVFGDAAGTAAGDVATDGKHSASGTYTISTAAINVSKSAAVYSDVNVTGYASNPKAVPGSVVTYTITITNNGGASATNVSISDSLATMIDAGYASFKTTFADGSPTCAGGTEGNAISTNNGGAWSCQAGNYNAGTRTLTVSGLTIAPGAANSVVIKYQINIL